jgi:hypothetical protein
LRFSRINTKFICLSHATKVYIEQIVQFIPSLQNSTLCTNFDEEGAFLQRQVICIDGYRQPISIEIGLGGDVSTGDLKNIADMFNSFVPKPRAKSKAKPCAKK